jgi:hypothetical protein
VVDGKRPIGEVPYFGDLPLNLLRGLHGRGDAAQASGVGHRSDHPGGYIPGTADGSLNYGDLDLQKIAQNGPEDTFHALNLAPGRPKL